MSMDTEKVCAICWDLFKEPKFLPCQHTFCLNCLKKLASGNKHSKTVTCPLCRKVTDIPSSGLEALLDNYFVNLREPVVKEKVVCAICEKETESINVCTCKHCLQSICFSCKPSHKLAVELSGITFPSSDNESEDDDEIEASDIGEISDQAPIPFHLLLSGSIKSEYHVVLEKAFQIPPLILAGNFRNEVTCVVPDKNEFALIVVNAGPNIIVCDKKGNVSQNQNTHLCISDVTLDLQNRILLSAPSEHSIMIMTENGFSMFAKTGSFVPLSVSSFVDGRIAVTGMSEGEGKKTMATQNKCGALQIFDSKGMMLNEIAGSPNQPILKNPRDVAVSHINNTIFVADSDLFMVLMFHEDGLILNAYQSQPRPFLFLSLHNEQGHTFVPIRLSVDSEGYAFVINACDATIHILNPNCEFHGYVLTKDTLEFGRPSCIALSPNGNLWMGDHSDGLIRVYKISSYKNHFYER